MQYLNTRKAIGLILALAFFIGGSQTALAAGTASILTSQPSSRPTTRSVASARRN